MTACFSLSVNGIPIIMSGIKFNPEDSPWPAPAKKEIKLKSTESSECYWTTKNKRTVTGRIELKKYDKKLKKHVIFKEAK